MSISDLFKKDNSNVVVDRLYTNNEKKTPRDYLLSFFIHQDEYNHRLEQAQLARLAKIIYQRDFLKLHLALYPYLNKNIAYPNGLPENIRRTEQTKKRADQELQTCIDELNKTNKSIGYNIIYKDLTDLQRNLDDKFIEQEALAFMSLRSEDNIGKSSYRVIKSSMEKENNPELYIYSIFLHFRRLFSEQKIAETKFFKNAIKAIEKRLDIPCSNTTIFKPSSSPKPARRDSIKNTIKRRFSFSGNSERDSDNDKQIELQNSRATSISA